MFEVTYDGVKITDFLKVTKLKRGVAIGQNVDYATRRGRKGMSEVGVTSFLVTYQMEFRMRDGLVAKRKQLATLFASTELKKLTFSDEPDRFYLARPSGNIPIDEFFTLGTGTIFWEIPSGVAYSNTEKTFSNVVNGVVGNTITVDNGGTEEMKLDLTASFTTDNGFFGLESDDRKTRVLFGDLAEVDGENYTRSEQLFNKHFFAGGDGWTLNNGVIPPVANPMYQQGTVRHQVEVANKEGFATPSSYGTAKPKWYGPSLSKIVPTDSNGLLPDCFSSTFRVDFNTKGAGSVASSQVGHQSITFSDENDNIIVAIVIEDNSPVAETSDLAVYVQGKRVWEQRNRKDFFVTARPGDGQHILVEKWGTYLQISWRLYQKDEMILRFYLKEPSPGTKIRLKKITWYGAKFNNLPTMQNNLIRALNLTVHNVPKWKDIPNKFQKGDVLTYGSVGKNLYCKLNEINELRLWDIGNTLVTARPGKSYLYVANSPFAEIPSVTLTGREVYAL